MPNFVQVTTIGALFYGDDELTNDITSVRQDALSAAEDFMKMRGLWRRMKQQVNEGARWEASLKKCPIHASGQANLSLAECPRCQAMLVRRRLIKEVTEFEVSHIEHTEDIMDRIDALDY